METTNDVELSTYLTRKKKLKKNKHSAKWEESFLSPTGPRWSNKN